MHKRWLKWSDYEERSLELYLRGELETRQLLAERIGRSTRAVKDKLRRRGKRRNPWKRWTEEETRAAAQRNLEALPGRSIGSIKQRLRRCKANAQTSR